MQSPSDGGSNNPPHVPPNDGARPSPQSQWPRWVHVVFFSFVVHLVMELWYTCDALVDFDGLVDLFGWTWALVIIYVIYIVMDVICADRCVDGWDIYVMDEIYMWWMRYMIVWIYLSRWNVKKLKNCRFESLCRVLHSAKDSGAECQDHGTRQRIFFKKIKLWRVPARGHSAKIFFKKNQTLPSVGQGALGKEFLEKK